MADDKTRPISTKMSDIDKFYWKDDAPSQVKALTIQTMEELARQQKWDMVKKMAEYLGAGNMLGIPSAGGPGSLPKASGSAGVANKESPNSSKLGRMICMRMRFEEGQKLPMAFMECHLSGDTVYVFLVHNGKAAVIEDEWNMFPSDAMITKLRLMLG